MSEKGRMGGWLVPYLGTRQLSERLPRRSAKVMQSNVIICLFLFPTENPAEYVLC